MSAPATTGVALRADLTDLEVQGVTVRFGALTALDDVSFTVARGAIHAVIGPNGAGKSTMFNVLSGVYRVSGGTVRFARQDLTELAPHRIAELGIARAFQNIALSGRQTVLDNLMLGRHRLMRTGFLAAGLRTPSARAEENRHLGRVREIADFIELGDKLHLPVGGLSYGDQKRVEVGRALATEPRVLLLDEPVAGMNAEETRRMGASIREIRDALGISVVLVEHDMGMVMGLADRITVLDFGRRIADGTPAEVQQDREVIRAYLGTGSDDDPMTAALAGEEALG